MTADQNLWLTARDLIPDRHEFGTADGYDYNVPCSWAVDCGALPCWKEQEAAIVAALASDEAPQ